VHSNNSRAAVMPQPFIGLPLREGGTIRPSAGSGTVHGNAKHERVSNSGSVFMSACSVVECEFRIGRPIRPQVTLVIGADENRAYWGH
jgi:hypothetical protein